MWREKEGDLAAQWADSGSLGAHYGSANRCFSGKPPAGVGNKHRRRLKTEENAKVVAAVWGTEFIKILAWKADLH